MDAIVSAIFGGMLIGLAAGLLLLLNGRIAGISNIVAGLFAVTREDFPWRSGFLSGLLLGGLSLTLLLPNALAESLPLELPGLVSAGLLVGFGAGLGRGCTSGHGICGLSRRSPRSLAATVTFMLVAMLTVFGTHYV